MRIAYQWIGAFISLLFGNLLFRSIHLGGTKAWKNTSLIQRVFEHVHLLLSDQFGLSSSLQQIHSERKQRHDGNGPYDSTDNSTTENELV
jgi:hypothetical protein